MKYNLLFKHILLIFCCCFFFSKSTLCQDKFRADFDCFASYDPESKEWSEWKKGSNTFVMNINGNGDIRLFKANGKSETFRSISKITRDVSKSGKKYQLMVVLDEEGEEIAFQYYEEGDVIFTFNNGLRIQFSNCVEDDE